MIFDENGKQMTKYQNAISCYSIDADEALKITKEAQSFFIAQWLGSSFQISRKEMQYLLGLRTREMDIEDIKNEKI